MENVEFIQMRNALNFSNSFVTEDKVNMHILLQFLIEFKEIYEREKVHLPYHINLIDELHANENAHSRIFAKLLRYKEHNKYPFLEKFLKFLSHHPFSKYNPFLFFYRSLKFPHF